MLVSKYVTFVVRADSPIKNAQGLIGQLRKDAAGISIAAATSAGNTSHIAAALVGRGAGADPKKMKIVIFNSGGDAMAALLGGHIDVATTSADGAVQHAQAGNVRIIGLAAPRRLPGALADVSTWKEYGIDMVVDNFRSLTGPRAMGAVQLAYWEDAVAKLVRADEWKKEVEKNFWVSNPQGRKDAARQIERQYQELKAVLVELGLAK